MAGVTAEARAEGLLGGGRDRARLARLGAGVMAALWPRRRRDDERRGDGGQGTDDDEGHRRRPRRLA